MINLAVINQIEAVKLKMAVIQYDYPSIVIDGMSEISANLELICQSLKKGNYPFAFKQIADAMYLLGRLPESNPLIDWKLGFDIKQVEALITITEIKAA